MFGELPSHPQLLNFRDNIHKEMLVHEKLISFFGGFKSDAHPMAIMVTEIDVIACGHAVLTYIICVMKPQVGVVGALSAFFNDSLDIHSPESRELACTRMVTHTDFIELVTRTLTAICLEQIAQMPTIAAIAYKTHIGQPIVYPRSDLSYAENFLHMMFATPTQDYVVNKVTINL